MGSTGITTVGEARVLDLTSDNIYENTSSEYQLYMYDIQTYTEVGVNTIGRSKLELPTFIKGKSSGASGFLKYEIENTVADPKLVVTNVSGQFIKNEELIINGEEESILTTEVYDHNLGDVKSVFQNKSGVYFNADTVLDRVISLSSVGTEFQMSGDTDTNVGILTSTNENLSTLARKNDIIIYSNPDDTSFSEILPSYAKITELRASGREVDIVGVTTVSGVNRGQIIGGTKEKSSVGILRPSFISKSSGFFSPLKYRNVSSVDLSQGDLNLTYQFTNRIVSNNTKILQINLDNEPDFQTLPEVSWKDVGSSYQLADSNGTIIPVNRGNVTIVGRQISIRDIPNGTYTLITTLDKKSVKSKEKKFNSIGDLTISRSKYESFRNWRRNI